ncbi:MAG: glutamine--tRNA ligase/YqeY domain fusion protein [Acidimicrobiales bacterium]
MSDPAGPSSDFIRERIRADQRSGAFAGRVQTRFPPEPNGYLHIGHAKSICLNFGLAAEFGGRCTLRMDDTNPLAENEDFVTGIEEDVRWLGFEWAGATRYASDYFEQLYEWAETLIGKGLAYVDDLDAEAISAYRGTFTEPGTDSPHRGRAVEENLDLFRRMRAGEFADGARVLRAKIDMAHPNPMLRDPVLYRIRHAAHHRTGDSWCIYPTYDWAHGQSDAIEGTTHSICTLEFDVHRPLYDWCLDQLELPGDRPQQIEFARLNLTHTLLSKRKLLQLVENGQVEGWDDPRMPTLRGLRRLGYPAAALRAFCAHIGVARMNGTHEIELLESFVREELNRTAIRRMAVLHPLRVVIENYPEGEVEQLAAVNNPEDPAAGVRLVPFSRVLYLEAEDFMEDPPKKFFRLSPGSEVRLRYAYFLTCTDVVKDAEGAVAELRCRYDPATRGGDAPDGRRVRATLHWVSADHAVDGEVRLYERLFTEAHPDSHEGRDPLEFLNPAALNVLRGAKLEPALAEAERGQHLQFERLGYFCADTRSPLVFHRTVGLKDDWAKIRKRGS